VTPDVVADIGNSRMKIGWCRDNAVVAVSSLATDDPASWDCAIDLALDPPIRWAVASVHPERLGQFLAWAAARGDEVAVIDNVRQLPLRVEVDEPDRVGIDRLLNAVSLARKLPPATAGIIIDVGTAVTVDLLDERHVFVGGAILPGPRLMFESLHRQTAKLPLIDLHRVPSHDPPGRNTRDAMTAGVMAAILGAADLLVREYAGGCRNPPWVVMTGGALGVLADYHFEGIDNTMTDSTLTLDGIRIAAGELP
jgi:type III pantothenate kinase